MTTRLQGPLKRELDLGGQAYTLTIDPSGLMLVRKGRRKGYTLRWADMVNGEAALATALNASLRSAPTESDAGHANQRPPHAHGKR